MLKADLIDQRAALIAYATTKLAAGDWHGLQDAASDLREIDAKLAVLAEIPLVETDPLVLRRIG